MKRTKEVRIVSPSDAAAEELHIAARRFARVHRMGKKGQKLVAYLDLKAGKWDMPIVVKVVPRSAKELAGLPVRVAMNCRLKNIVVYIARDVPDDDYLGLAGLIAARVIHNLLSNQVSVMAIFEGEGGGAEVVRRFSYEVWTEAIFYVAQALESIRIFSIPSLQAFYLACSEKSVHPSAEAFLTHIVGSGYFGTPVEHFRATAISLIGAFLELGRIPVEDLELLHNRYAAEIKAA